MNLSQGHGWKTPSQAIGITTITATPETVGDQFVDTEMTSNQSAATATMTIPPLEDAEPLEGAVAPSSDAYNPACNKHTQSHSPKTEDDDSEVKSNPSSQDTVISSQSQPEHQGKTVEDNPPTPDIHPGSPDVVIAQLEVKAKEPMVVPCKFCLLLYQLPWVPSLSQKRRTNYLGKVMSPQQKLHSGYPRKSQEHLWCLWPEQERWYPTHISWCGRQYEVYLKHQHWLFLPIRVCQNQTFLDI